MRDLMCGNEWLERTRYGSVHLRLPGEWIVITLKPEIVSRITEDGWLHRGVLILQKRVLLCQVTECLLSFVKKFGLAIELAPLLFRHLLGIKVQSLVKCICEHQQIILRISFHL